MNRSVLRTERAAWIAIPFVLVGILVVLLGVEASGRNGRTSSRSGWLRCSPI